MASTTAAELRELTDEELTLRVREAKEELFNFRFQMATGQLDNNRRLRTVRHDIARIYTIMRERELGLSAAPDEGAARTRTQPAGCGRSVVPTSCPTRWTRRSGSASRTG